MEEKKRFAFLGILLSFCLLFSGCDSGSNASDLGVEDVTEQPKTNNPESFPHEEIVGSQEASEALFSNVESIEVYFDQYHGDDGIGTLGYTDADTEGLIIGKDSEGHEEWGWRTGNGKILPSSDGNKVKDSFFRFDLQNHIQYQNPIGQVVQIEIEYLDAGYDEFNVEYDAYSGGPNNDGTFKPTENIKKTNSGEFKTALFTLEDAYFADRIHGNADFQINDLKDGSETIRRVIVRIFGGGKVSENVSMSDEPEEESTQTNPVEGWAVLAEKDDFSDVGMSDMLVDYVDILLLQDALAGLGWDPNHIHEIREFDRDTLQVELDWLEEVADENDVVFFFVTGHSGYLSKVVLWQEFFPEEWSQIKSQRRLLLVDSCLAARYTEVVLDDPNPNISIATGDSDELLWKALKDEGLPFIGAVFNHYFSDGLTNPDADADRDGWISVQEAALWAEEHQRVFMHEVLFAVPEYLQGFHDLGVSPDLDPTFPDVIVHDTIGEPLYLNLEVYK